MTESPSTAKAIVFFDGGCPLCRREIAHYQRLDRKSHIHWVDINSCPRLLRQYGISVETAMRVFHVLDPDRVLHKGGYGFVVLWQFLPGYRWLAVIVTRLRLTSLLNAVYLKFAAWRYQRRSCNRSHCRPK